MSLKQKSRKNPPMRRFFAPLLLITIYLGSSLNIEVPEEPQVCSAPLVETVQLPRMAEPKRIEVSAAPHRGQPIYEVFKNGHRIEVSAEVQWMIRDFAEKYGFREDLLFGLCLVESTFDAAALSGGTKGLCQISPFWISGAKMPRFTEDYPQRDLFDPYDNLLTCMEMWCYARDTYNIDTSTEQGMKDLLYWHNTGKYIKNVKWAYSDKVFRHAKELKEVNK